MNEYEDTSLETYLLIFYWAVIIAGIIVAS